MEKKEKRRGRRSLDKRMHAQPPKKRARRSAESTRASRKAHLRSLRQNSERAIPWRYRTNYLYQNVSLGQVLESHRCLVCHHLVRHVLVYLTADRKVLRCTHHHPERDHRNQSPKNELASRRLDKTVRHQRLKQTFGNQLY